MFSSRAQAVAGTRRVSVSWSLEIAGLPVLGSGGSGLYRVDPARGVITELRDDPKAPLQVLLPALTLATPLVNVALPLLRPALGPLASSTSPQPPSSNNNSRRNQQPSTQAPQQQQQQQQEGLRSRRAQSPSPMPPDASTALPSSIPPARSRTSSPPPQAAAAAAAATPPAHAASPPSPARPPSKLKNIAMRPLASTDGTSSTSSTSSWSEGSPGPQQPPSPPPPPSTQRQPSWLSWQRASSPTAGSSVRASAAALQDDVVVKVVPPLPGELGGPVQTASYTDVGSGSSWDERSRSPSPTPDEGAEQSTYRLQDLAGVWQKVPEASQPELYEDMLEALGLSGLQRVTARLIEGMEIKVTQSTFTVSFLTIVPFFRVSETMRFGDQPSKLMRRDLRSGQQTATLKPVASGGLHVTFVWPEPSGGQLIEEYQLVPGDRQRLTVTSILKMGNGRAARVVQVYTRSQGSREDLLRRSAEKNGSMEQVLSQQRQRWGRE